MSSRIPWLAEDLAGRKRPFKALGAVVAGGLAFAFTIGGQTVLLAPGRGVDAAFGMIGDAFAGGASRWLSASVAHLEAAWSTSVDLGVFQYLYTLVVVLGMWWFVSLLLAEWRDE